MNKKYLKFQLKQHLSLIIIFLVVTCSIALIAGLSIPGYRTAIYNSETGTYYRATGNVAMIGFPSVCALLLATLVPISTYHYRLKANEADLYLQVPFKPKRFRWQRILFTLVLTLALTTILFWFATGVYALNCLKPLPQYSHEPEATAWLETMPAYIDYGYVALSYLYLIAAVSAQFFLSSFAISLGKNVVYALIGLALFETTFYTIPTTVIAYTANFVEINSGDALLSMLYTNASITAPGSMIFAILYPLCLGSSPFTASMGYFVAGQVLYFVTAIGAGLYCFLSPEPSGEHAGKLGFHPKWFLYVYHICTGLNGLASFASPVGTFGVISGTLVSTFALTFIMWLFRYYLLLALCKATFRFKKGDWIWFGSVSGAALIAGIVTLIVS